MELTDADIQHLAKLARLDLSAEQKHTFAQQLTKVLAYVDQINDQRVTEETAHRPRPAVAPVELRPDAVETFPGTPASQAPAREGASVVSPPVG